MERRNQYQHLVSMVEKVIDRRDPIEMTEKLLILESTARTNPDEEVRSLAEKMAQRLRQELE